MILDVGGFDAASWLTTQVIVGPNVKISDHLRLSVAYRYLSDDFEGGGFRWKIAEHGILAGAGIRF